MEAKQLAFIHRFGFSGVNDFLPPALEKEGWQVHKLDTSKARQVFGKTDRLLWQVSTALGFGLKKKYGLNRFWPWLYAVETRSRYLQTRVAELEAADAVLMTQTVSVPPKTSKPFFVYTDAAQPLIRREWPAMMFMKDEAEKKAWFGVERKIYGLADKVFAYNDCVKESLVSECGVPGEKIEVVGVGANYAELPAPSAAKKQGLLFVCSEFERQGGFRVLEAFKRLRELRPDLELTVVGETSKAAHSAAPKGTRFTGKLHGPPLEQAFDDAQGFLMPSHYGGVQATLEAMAHGCSCVLADNAMLSMFRDCALPVNAGNVAEIADAVDRLLVDKTLRERLARKARERVEARFNWPAVARKMSETMREFV